jgi:hypothetical protein
VPSLDTEQRIVRALDAAFVLVPTEAELARVRFRIDLPGAGRFHREATRL